MPLLTVDKLTVSFGSSRHRVKVVDDVSFSVAKGETLGIVGESGSGKSVTVMSAIRLLPSPPSQIDGGAVNFDGIALTTLSKRALQDLWGNRIGVVFQDPMASLNPTFSIGFQLMEALRLHRRLSAIEIKQQVMHMLERVGINAPELRLKQYPHELSGGMRQRVMIAMALICHPQLLIADEPTTALDVTMQAQILDMLRNLQDELGMGILIITHDLGVVAEFCDRVAVMYAGRIVETASVKQLFTGARHPYTKGLLASIPQLSTRKGARLPVIEGAVPSFDNRPKGCAFVARCARAQVRCRDEQPILTGDDEHQFACFNPEALRCT